MRTAGPARSSNVLQSLHVAPCSGSAWGCWRAPCVPFQTLPTPPLPHRRRTIPRWQLQQGIPARELRQGAYKQQLRDHEEAELELVRCREGAEAWLPLPCKRWAA